MSSSIPIFAVRRRTLKPILRLISKELTLDWKTGHVMSSLALYVIATCYAVYMSFQHISEAHVWNTVLWIIILFAAFNTVSRTFDQDRDGRAIYLFSLASPQQVFIAKTIYTILIMVAVALLSVLVYSFFLPLDSKEISLGYFLLGIVLGSAGFACTLTLISAIAWKSGSKTGMVAILGFPIILPLLFCSMAYSSKLINGADWSVLYKFAIAILSIDIISLLLGYLLFPYIWRE